MDEAQTQKEMNPFLRFILALSMTGIVLWLFVTVPYHVGILISRTFYSDPTSAFAANPIGLWSIGLGFSMWGLMCFMVLLLLVGGLFSGIWKVLGGSRVREEFNYDD
jgi:hypothetical protein